MAQRGESAPALGLDLGLLQFDMGAPSASGSSLLREDLKPISYALIAIVLAFGVVCGVLLYVRRHRFPMNGRATVLVMPVLFFGVCTAVLRITRTVEDPLPCWARHVDYYTSLVYANIALVRIYRLFFKLKLSNEILSAHRAERRRKEELQLREREQLSPSSKRSGALPQPFLHQKKSVTPVTPTRSRSVGGEQTPVDADGNVARKNDRSASAVAAGDETRMNDSTVTAGGSSNLTSNSSSNSSSSSSSTNSTHSSSSSSEKDTQQQQQLQSIESNSTHSRTISKSAAAADKVVHVSSLPEGRDRRMPQQPPLTFGKSLVSVREINIEVLDNDPGARELYLASSAKLGGGALAQGWFTRRQRWGSTTNLSRISLVWNVCEVALWFGIFQGAYGCANLNDDLALLMIGTRTSIGYALFFYLAWSVRNLRDGYFLKQEAVYAAVSYLFLFLVLSVRLLMGRKHPVLSLAVACATLHPTLVFCVFPIAKSLRWDFHPFKPWSWVTFVPLIFRDEQPTNSEMEWNDLPLVDLLTKEEHKEAREAFENHLASEFAIENIVFYYRAKEFHELSDESSDDQLALKAADIFFTFIAVGSPSQVNIVANTRQNIEREILDKFPNFAEFNPHKHKRRPSVSQTFSSGLSSGGLETRRVSLKPGGHRGASASPRPGHRERAGSASRSHKAAVGVEMPATRPHAASHSHREKPPPLMSARYSASGNHLDSLPTVSSAASHAALASASSHVSAHRERGRTMSASQSIDIDLNDRLSHDLFEVARTQVYALMARDPYSRYKAARRQSPGATSI